MTGKELERYVGMFKESVWATALCCVRNVSDADDVTQDVFLALFTYTGSFAGDEHVKAWLLRCAINRSRDILRSHWYKFSEPLSAAEEIPAPESDGGNSLLPYIMKLGRKQRITLYMHYYEGYTVKEIAGMLGIKESAVKLRLVRGRKQLGELLSSERKGHENGLQEDI